MANGCSGKTVTVKIKYSDFQQITRSRTVSHFFGAEAEVLENASHLLATAFPFRKPVRLLGVTISNLGEGTKSAEQQLDLAI
ncbi:DNA polymerase IV [compost metagenome]